MCQKDIPVRFVDFLFGEMRIPLKMKGFSNVEKSSGKISFLDTKGCRSAPFIPAKRHSH